ncbi:hypothetical protein [Xylophilus sp.]|uniref:hypothetical protein n=1 Tax=Xylophilus sp. TaxID=2653893 RepID=UPI0013BC5AF4|nr:hypothetical protein [Xylophilus sp.]KAF1044759.1 MAG: hypothetical protein GAK38_03359 [Xylophilus sp.]
MLHPLVSTLIKHPDLVLDHVLGYGSLVREEAKALGGQAVQRAVAWGLVLVMGLVGLVLAGTAVMIGLLQSQFHWVLVVVPGVPVAATLVAWRVARRPLPGDGLRDLREQLQADLVLFRRAGDAR